MLLLTDDPFLQKHVIPVRDSAWHGIYAFEDKSVTLSPQLTKPCHFPLWHEM